jgi:DHA2 family multidrug resistance protein-like MFS transporter
VVQTNSEFGYALGIAVMGSVGTLVYRTQIADHLPVDLPGAAASTARESLTGAIPVAAELPGDLGAAVLAAAQDAFSSSLHTVAAITGVVVAGMGVLIVTKLRRIPPLDQAAPSDADTTMMMTQEGN